MRKYIQEKVDLIIDRFWNQLTQKVDEAFNVLLQQITQRFILLEQANTQRLDQKCNELTANFEHRTAGIVQDVKTVTDPVVSELFDIKYGAVVIKYKKTDPRAKAPTRAYTDDAGWDVYALDSVFLPPGHLQEVRIGLAFEIPQGYHIQIHTRSSYGKRGLRCHLGIIDTGYRNEVSIWVINGSSESYQVNAGDKVCQLLVLPVPKSQFIQASELSDSDRGIRGHGSSGR